ncbi:MAG: hypothetical protein HW415_792 [Deltaproteobacteria bacterium]|nr:hypothetical protein [Deltaproteobacteria bacterium]
MDVLGKMAESIVAGVADDPGVWLLFTQNYSEEGGFPVPVLANQSDNPLTLSIYKTSLFVKNNLLSQRHRDISLILHGVVQMRNKATTLDVGQR